MSKTKICVKKKKNSPLQNKNNKMCSAEVWDKERGLEISIADLHSRVFDVEVWSNAAQISGEHVACVLFKPNHLGLVQLTRRLYNQGHPVCLKLRVLLQHIQELINWRR